LLVWPPARARSSSSEGESKNASLLFRAGSLPERAKHASEVLQEATTLVQELQDELTARTELLEDFRRRVEEASRQAEDLERLDDETVRVATNLVDQVFKSRLGDVKREGRFIGTMGAFVIGIIVIVFAHFVLGF